MLFSPVPEEDFIRARVNEIQWASLAGRFNFEKAFDELHNLDRYKCVRVSKSADLAVVESLLSNGWASEALLKLTRDTFASDALRTALTWAFPQAYYSVFSIGIAYFRLVGFTQFQSHARFIKKFGEELALNNYPPCVSAYVSGGNERSREGFFLTTRTLHSRLDFTEEDPLCWDAHIMSLLNATRSSDIRERLSDLRLKNKKGELKKSFNESDYDKASKGLGNTSILSFIYRKRIKANYQDIDSYLSGAVNPKKLYDNLLVVVGALNGIHEAYIRKAVGVDQFQKFLSSRGAKSNGKCISERLKTLDTPVPW